MVREVVSSWDSSETREHDPQATTEPPPLLSPHPCHVLQCISFQGLQLWLPAMGLRWGRGGG